MSVSNVISISTGVIAVGITLVNYVLFQAKLRWEMDQFKVDKKRIWEKVDVHETLIKELQLKEHDVPIAIEKRLERLETSVDKIAEGLAELRGEVKAIAVAMQSKHD